MAHSRLKITPANIISLWFGSDTPIREYKKKLNPDLWEACQLTDRFFIPPSGAVSIEQYRRSDLIAFAQAVQGTGGVAPQRAGAVANRLCHLTNVSKSKKSWS